MTKDNAREYIPLLEALADGELETNTFTVAEPKWVDCTSTTFNFSAQYYRRRPKPVMVPLEKKDINLHNDLFAFGDGDVHIGSCVTDSSIWIGSAQKGVPWKDAMNLLKISRDGGKTWQRCEKEVKQ